MKGFSKDRYSLSVTMAGGLIVGFTGTTAPDECGGDVVSRHGVAFVGGVHS